MIPVNEPLLGQRELEYLTECLRTGWISSSGRFLEAFEQAWAAYCGMDYGIAVSNGTTALQLAVACLDLQPGDEIILPSFTIISCAQAVTYCGAVPVLVDSEPNTWCLDVQQVEPRITPRTRAIMPVHIYGHPVDVDPLRALADRYGLRLIEDAAEAHGAEYLEGHGSPKATWKRCGGLGDISVFSFYANKPITTGEGGMLLTSDPRLADKARSLRNLCFRPERRFLHTDLGFNFRLTNMQAAIGLAQVERLEEILARKRWMGETYTEHLSGVPGLRLQAVQPWARPIYWMFGLIVDESTGLDAAQLADRLQALGVETRPFFLGMHEQPAFHDLGLFRTERFPVAERLARQGLYLPSGVALTEAQLDEVCSAVTHVLRNRA